MLQTFESIIFFLKKQDVRKIAILLHQNADADALASAVGLKELVQYSLPHCEINLFASSINALTTNLISSFKIQIEETINFGEYDAFFFCDVNNILQLGELALEQLFPENKPFFIIDHHSFHEFSEKARFNIIDPTSTSTSEIISYLFYKLGVSLSSDLATLLLSGIISDSRRFLIFSPKVFEITNFLSKKGDYEKALTLLSLPVSLSERIAKLKGLQRVILKKINNDLIAVSHVSSFESAVARSLTSIGSDLAIVISKQKPSKLRVSLRCKKSFAKRNNINLGEIAYKLAAEKGGTGGGHVTAAGINLPNLDSLPNDIDKLKQEFLKLVLNKIY